MRSAAFISLLAVSACLVAEAKVDAVRKPHQPDKREGFEREIFRGNFEACSFNLEYTLDKKDGAIVKKAWGDYFFGLRLGYSPKNGGWSIWDFLQVYAKTKAGVVNVLEKARPVLFSGYSAGGADFIALDWLTEGERRLKLRFVTYPSHRDWLFLRVDFGDIPIQRIVLGAFPGNAAAAEGRERHIASREHDWNLSADAAEFTPVSPFLLLYSRYVDDRFGNKLVYRPEQIGKIRAGKASAYIGLNLFPKDGATTMDFAFGFFAHKEPGDQIVRFLGEDGDSILSALKAVDWSAAPDPTDFRESVRIALLMGIGKKELNAIAGRYLAAAKAGDIATTAACAGEVLKLRQRRVRTGLAEFE